MELQRRALSKNGDKAVLCNRLVEAVLNNQKKFNAGGEVSKAGGMQVAFLNSEDGWVLG